MSAPGSGVSIAEAAHILGCSLATVGRWVDEGLVGRDKSNAHRGLDRDEVERLAALRWRHHQGPEAGEESYWITAPEAARILDVSRARVGQLVAKGKLPYLATACGVRLFRRHQLEVIANARTARRRSVALVERQR